MLKGQNLLRSSLPKLGLNYAIFKMKSELTGKVKTPDIIISPKSKQLTDS